jgi:heavy metal sensor kinase
MFTRSIGFRLTVWYTGVLTLSLLILGGSAYALLSYSLMRDLDVALNSVAQTLAERARNEAVTFFPAEVDRLFRRHFGFSPLDPYFEMFDPSGQRDSRQQGSSRQIQISPEVLENAARGIATFETDESSGQPVRVLTKPVMRGTQLVNLVQVGMSLENMEKTRTRFLLILAALLPVGLILASTGGWLLARRALAPVGQMTNSARQISAQHLAERLHETGSGDELDRLARTLNEMLERLDKAFHQMRQFSADASHELQTPLTVLRGELEFTLRAPRDEIEYERTLASALEEIDRLSDLVDGMLYLARTDAGVARMGEDKVDLARLIDKTCNRLDWLAKQTSVRLTLGPVQQVSIQGDTVRLGQLITNIVQNGLTYTPAGGDVTVSLKVENDFAVLEVADTGVGLSPEEQNQIFLPFYRATEARSTSGGGAGLGLSIARAIAQSHGGKITVKSLPDKGSTFTVSLPLEQSPQQA